MLESDFKADYSREFDGNWRADHDLSALVHSQLRDPTFKKKINKILWVYEKKSSID